MVVYEPRVQWGRKMASWIRLRKANFVLVKHQHVSEKTVHWRSEVQYELPTVFGEGPIRECQ